MKVTPSLEEVRNIAKNKDCKICQISTEILSDFITPIEALRILKSHSSHVYLLESARANETWGRWSFLGFNPTLEITLLDGVLKIGDSTICTNSPWIYLREILSDYKSFKQDGLPPFSGGLVGYFAYDYISYIEPKVIKSASNRYDFYDLDLMLFDKVIAFDNLKQKIVLIANMRLENIDENYKNAISCLEDMIALLRGKNSDGNDNGILLSEVKPIFSKERFCDMVECAKGHIFRGDIFQIVLSNTLEAKFRGSLLNTYRMLRTINPSSYMFYFRGNDIEVAGASPETLVKLENGILRTFPLAGTRARGKNEEEDRILESELLGDKKELSEHNMLVDLGRNDLGKVSEFGSVEVERLREVVRFSHVMHIGSTIKSKIKADFDALDALAATLPAGTLSGAPKIRACELINALENNKRGIYGGAIGYIDFNGNMDTCIAIRIAYKKDDKVFVRSGAGIVADSIPESEYNECINKAKAVLNALKSGAEL